MAALSGSWLLRAEFVELDTDGQQRALLNSDPYQAWLDAGRLELPLLLRGRQTGDLFEPLGMNGQRVSLKDWMIKQKLPQRARAGWPLVCSGAEIVWIPGFQLAHFARITPDTRQILHLNLSYETH
jgi:tRNA(Ile)-lysidine synthase